MVMSLSSLFQYDPRRPRNIRATKIFVLFHVIHLMMNYDIYKKIFKNQRSVQTYMLQIYAGTIIFLSVSSFKSRVVASNIAAKETQEFEKWRAIRASVGDVGGVHTWVA